MMQLSASVRPAPGSARFLAAAVNTLVVFFGLAIGLTMIFAVVWVGVLIIFALYLLIDLAVAMAFIGFRGIWGEIGRGMLIAWISIPVGAVALVGLYGLGPVVLRLVGLA